MSLDLNEAAARLGRLVDLLAGAGAVLIPGGSGEPATATALVLEARSLATQIRDQIDGALAMEHERRRSEHAAHVAKRSAAPVGAR